MSFHNILLPKFLEAFLVARSIFNTSKIISSSGIEIRSLDHAYAKGRFLLKDCFLSEDDFTLFNNFFKARRGSRFAFILKDFADHRVEKQFLGKGDGTLQDFQCFKIYNDTIYPYIRKISRIKMDSIKVYIDENEVTNWQINENNGIISLDCPLKNNSIISASFEFYVTVRFAEDTFDYELRSDGTIEILNVSLIEVLE